MTYSKIEISAPALIPGFKVLYFVSVSDAAIRANGKTFSVFNMSSSGGSSGGTIILESMKVKNAKRTNPTTHTYLLRITRLRDPFH